MALLSDLYSSDSQGELFRRSIEREFFVAALRLDILLFGRVVLPDAHVFDGPLFVYDFTPASLADAVGSTAERPTIEIRARAGNLGESLGSWLYGPAGFNPMEFRVLGDADLERRVAGALASRPAAPVTSPARMLRTFRSMIVDNGVADDVADRLIAGWQTWGAEVPPGLLVTGWPNRPFPLAAVAGRAPLERDNFFTGRGHAAFQQVHQQTAAGLLARKTEADALLRSLEQVRSPAAKTQRDFALVREWYHDCRQVALADQHGVVLSTRADSHPLLLDAVLGGDAPATFDTVDQAEHDAVQRTLLGLRDLSGTEFAELYAHTVPFRRSWLVYRSKTALRQLVGELTRTAGIVKSVARPGWYQQERIFLPVGAALAGLAAKMDPTMAALSGALAYGVQSAAIRASDYLRAGSDRKFLVRWIERHY